MLRQRATLQDMRNAVPQFTRAGEQPLAQHFTHPRCEGAGPLNIKESSLLEFSTVNAKILKEEK